ncbi:MAG TPA: MvaI/BcnI family restriction endonuclease [Bacteroidia bacterium]|jgi:hypothetical protein|nr:MvaI/BcnI family restriction endonuclease [Bacteroidia bacterium]
MNLKNLIKLYSDIGCTIVYIKTLAANDNSKNQIYLGGSFDVLNIFPIKDITADDDGDWKRTRFKTKLDFYWLNEEGHTYHAPDAQFILYPKYPEVRFSGFLRGCERAPSDLMANRIEGRLLFMGIDSTGKIFGYITDPKSHLSKEFNTRYKPETQGVFRVIQIENNKIQKDSRQDLLKELKRIHKTGWINSKRLGSKGEILACESPNCGVYTLEAELGITPNGYSEPDYKGWEVKQFNVRVFEKFKNEIITLMTPEPTGGFYVEKSVRAFIEKFGYEDKRGRKDRMNFGGIYKSGIKHAGTGLTLLLDGFDVESNKIKKAEGSIVLVGKKDVVAASWSFASLLKHWNRKHNKACYVPSLSEKDPKKRYAYGNRIILGTGTDFTLFLKQMSMGNIVYDPAIKMENISLKPTIKRRSQFRIKSGFLQELYRKNEVVDLTKI